MGFWTFVFAVSALSMLTYVANNWIRAKHGYDLPDDCDQGPTSLPMKRQVGLLMDENEDLKGKLGRLEERLATLERIATDPAERTAREIENLR